MIKIIGLGPGSSDALTLGAVEAIRNAGHVYLRTKIHPTVKYLIEKGIKFETYDDRYEKGTNFDEIYESIAEDLILQHEKHGDIVYAVPGHPLVAEKSVSILINLCRGKDIPIQIVPAVSFIDVMLERLQIDPINGIKIIDAFDLGEELLDKRTGIIITQVYDNLIASEVKLKLLDYYRGNENMEIYFVRGAGIPEVESIRKIKIYELDRQKDIDYLTSVYVPQCTGINKDFPDLVHIMDILRGDGGCPWDKEQTHETLKQNLIEESYEVLDAIDKNDFEHMKEELGDVLLQVVFHARMGKEEGYFDIQDVVQGICDKMINRHPHIFGDIKADSSEEVLKNWDEIKKKEHRIESYTDELRYIPKNLPALMRADKVQRKAKKVGFDWDNVEGAISKVLEELNEVKDVYKGKNRAKIIEEVGDLIFAAVNVSRFLDIDPEIALNSTIDKFIERFAYMDNKAKEAGLDLADMKLEEMDRLWEQSKKKSQ